MVMYLVMRKGVSASPTEMLVPAAQDTVRCIEKYAHSPEWRIAFPAPHGGAASTAMPASVSTKRDLA